MCPLNILCLRPHLSALYITTKKCVKINTEQIINKVLQKKTKRQEDKKTKRQKDKKTKRQKDKEYRKTKRRKWINQS